jgi:hypothetical protein
MADLVPVDHDPFAGASATPAAMAPTPRLVPVDHDPFASAPAPALSDIPKLALQNAPGDAWQLAKGVGQMVAHPLNTAAGLTGLAVPEPISKAQQYISHKIADQLPEGTAKDWINQLGDIQANAPAGLRKYITDSYGSWDNFKRSMAEHPVRTATDIASVLSGGETALSSVAPKTSAALGTVARGGSLPIGPLSLPIPGIDPVANLQRVAGGAADLAGKAAKYPVAVASGLTPAAQTAIARDAARGSTAAQAAMRGSSGLDSVDMARAALGKLAEERQQQYLANRTVWGGDNQVISHAPIDQALADAAAKVTSPGSSFVKDPKALQTVKEMQDIILDHKTAPGETFNPISMDALKQRLGVVREDTTHTSLSRNVANQVYQAAVKTITDNAPNYAKAMKDYQVASDQLNEISKSLSLGPKAQKATAVGKLQSMLRNDVSGNYGQRAKLGDVLSKYAPDLVPTVAGEMASSILPRGLVGRMGDLGSIATAVASPHLIPGALAYMAASSPRVVGEAINAANRAREPAGILGRGASRLANRGLLSPGTE